MSNVKLLRCAHHAGGVLANKRADYDDAYRILVGLPVRDDGIGHGTCMQMSDDAPEGTELLDLIENSSMYLIISDRFKAILAASMPPEHVEFLRCTMLDHGGKPVPAGYWNVNLLDPVDCVNREQSIIETAINNPDIFMYPEKVVFDFDKIPDDRLLFKVKGFLGDFFIRDSLIRAIEAAGLTNVAWSELSQIEEDGGF